MSYTNSREWHRARKLELLQRTKKDCRAIRAAIREEMKLARMEETKAATNRAGASAQAFAAKMAEFVKQRDASIKAAQEFMRVRNLGRPT